MTIQGRALTEMTLVTLRLCKEVVLDEMLGVQGYSSGECLGHLDNVVRELDHLIENQKKQLGEENEDPR